MKKNKIVSMLILSSLATGLVAGPLQPANAVTAGTTTLNAGVTILHTEDKPKVDIDGTVLIKAMHNADMAGKPVGDIPLQGYMFKVSWFKGYYDTAQDALASGAPTMEAVWQTDVNGMFNVAKDAPVQGTWDQENGINVLPLGTLVIEEVSSVNGVDIWSIPAISHIKLNGSGEAYVENVQGFSGKQNAATIPTEYATATLSPFDQGEEWKGRISVVKLDKRFLNNKSRNQGDSDMTGIEFKIINQSLASVWVDGQEKRPGDVVTTFAVAWNDQKNVFEATSEKVLPYGTYKVKEHSATPGYLLNADWEYNFSVRSKDQYIEVPVGQQPENDVPTNNLIMGKMDSELNQFLHNGGSSELTGTIFNVINASQNPVIYQGVEYAPGQIMGEIATQANHPNVGQISAEVMEALPYGTYRITEKTPPKGYIHDTAWSKTVVVREDGVVQEFLTADTALQNQVKRFNLEFKKIREEDSTPMANIAFKITDIVTGESHIVVTDENGRFDTETLDPLTKTNANDPTSPNTNGAVQVVDGEWKVVDESKLDNEAGLWFVGADPTVTQWTSATSYTVNGIQADPIDPSKGGPFQFATYSLEELRQPANEGRILYKGNFRLDKNGMKPGYKLDLNSIENRKVNVYTDATTVISETGAKYNIAPAKPNQKIIDEVVLDNFVVGKAYVLDSKLNLLDKQGNFVRVVSEGSQTITNKLQTFGTGTSVQTVFNNVDLTGLEGHKLVATQVVKGEDGTVLFEHVDYTNEAQMISIPEIGTTAMGDIDKEEDGSQDTITISDTIHYTNLEAGKTYTAKGKLMDKSTGKPYLDRDGNEITAETTFTPNGEMLSNEEGYVLLSGGGKAVSGDVVVTFTFPAPMDAPGKTLVAFESVESDGMEWAVHADIEDENQTITIPKVETKASDPVDGDNEVPANTETVIRDTVHLKNLVVGNTYDVTGTVHLKSEDGKDAGVVGEPVTKQVVATATEMEIILETTVNLKDLAGKDIVWFEELSRNGVRLGLHADINDAGQTLHIPKIGTKLATIEGAKEVQVGHTWTVDADGKVIEVTKISPTELKLVDIVEYTNLTPGKEYLMKGELHRKVVKTTKTGTTSPNNEGIEADKLICESGGVISKAETVRFTPEERNGVVEVPFIVTIEDEKDLTLVATEHLVSPKKSGDAEPGNDNSDGNNGNETPGTDEDGQIVASHEDYCDEEQSVNIIDIKTTLKGKTNNDKQVVKGTNETLVDTVRYNNLVVGKTYEMCGTLMDKETGDKILDAAGKDIRSCKNFVPEKPTGSVDIEFTIDSTLLQGKTVVAFEDLAREGRNIAVHADIEDKEQTVYVAKIGTTLKDREGNKVIDLNLLEDKTKVSLVDTIKYENLIPGEKYTAKGCLMDFKTKKVKEGTSCKTVEFIAEKANGSVDVEFTLDATKFNNGDKVVAFEEVNDKNGKLIGDHKDFNDKNQTVEFTKTVRPENLAKTGASLWGTTLVGLVILGMGVGALRASRKTGESENHHG